MMTYPRAEFLVETDWLASQLNARDLRIYDCAALPSPNPDRALRAKYPIKQHSGRVSYEEGHIPNAAHIDVPTDLADKSSELPMMMPPVQQVVDVIIRAGIGDDCRVFLYSSTNPMWATRVWWMLKAVGFENAAVLNGGLAKWVAEGRATSTAGSNYPVGTFNATPRKGIFVDKERVRAALDDSDTLLIHALAPSVFDGSDNTLVFGRRGRIPGSVNIPSGTLHDAETGAYLPSNDLHRLFETARSDSAKHIITYCGGAVNATNNAFALALLGYENVSVYDGSMCEWGNDESLPIEMN